MAEKILLVGNGGREHALAWKLSKSRHLKGGKIYYTGANAGIESLQDCSGNPLTEQVNTPTIDDIAKFAKEKWVSMAVIGPEAPLCEGIVDKLSEAGIRAFGPSKNASQLEGDKAWAKDRLTEWGVPTAKYMKFTDAEEASGYVRWHGAPIVVKASGLAAGKGAIVCPTVEEALEAIKITMVDKKFKSAGDTVVIEDFLEGEEASILSFVDGEHIRTLVSAQDHKRAYDNDEGPNTGGMGAYCPAPVASNDVLRKVHDKILKPTVEGMAEKGMPFKGVLYAGLMIGKNGDPYVIEYNVRCGDPEIHPISMIMGGDFYEIMQACIDGNLNQVPPMCVRPGVATGVVMASLGYPEGYEKGKLITGLDEINEEEAIVFHAGTKKTDDGRILTNGGRVLCVTAYGHDFSESIKKAYAAVDKINFEGGAMYRKDIGAKALKRVG